MGSNEIGCRDLDSEAHVYLSKIASATTVLESLYPIDTPEKVDEAVKVFDQIYAIIGFTTLDTDLENAILGHPSMTKLTPEVRRAIINCEAAFEISIAHRIVLAEDKKEARAILEHGPIHVFYKSFVPFEWSALLVALGRVPESVAILGSGALPETGIWVARWARANGKRLRVHNVDIVPERLELSRRVYAALGKEELDEDDVTYEASDANDKTMDLSSFDAVYFNATLGSSVWEKENILLGVVKRMRKGAYLVTRSTYSLKTMAYPPVSIQTPQVLARLLPVVTLHSSGEAGRTVNSSVVISRVL